jgi:hypothetical protein
MGQGKSSGVVPNGVGRTMWVGGGEAEVEGTITEVTDEPNWSGSLAVPSPAGTGIGIGAEGSTDGGGGRGGVGGGEVVITRSVSVTPRTAAA